MQFKETTKSTKQAFTSLEIQVDKLAQQSEEKTISAHKKKFNKKI